MPQKEFSGFYFPQERWADNRHLYESVLAGRSSVVPREEAERQLTFYTRFSPDLPHDRLVAQEWGIYVIECPSWTKPTPKANLAIPRGGEKKILEVDLGAELVSTAGGSPYAEEIVKQNVVQKLPDGTFLRGEIFRRILPEASNLAVLEEYVSLEFGNRWYSLHPRVEIQQKDQIYVYHLTSYVAIDGQRIEENREKILPAFKTEQNGTAPLYFRSWVAKNE